MVRDPPGAHRVVLLGIALSFAATIVLFGFVVIAALVVALGGRDLEALRIEGAERLDVGTPYPPSSAPLLTDGVGLPPGVAGDTENIVAQMEEVIDRAEDALEEAAESTWLERLARAGLAARGLLYVFVAILAVKVATGHNETRADKQGALQAVLRQPFGRVLVLGLAVGFAGYAMWRFVEAAVGPPDEPNARKAMFKRIGYAARGVLYTFVSASAVKLFIWSKDANASDRMETDLTARVLDWPGGTWLIQGVGLGLIAAGLYIGWRGVSGKFRKRLKSVEMGPGERFWIRGVGTFGMLARMVISIMMGVFLIVAARQHNSEQAVGIDGALKRLADWTYGPTLLVAVAIGLGAYGLYSFAEARYRRVGER